MSPLRRTFCVVAALLAGATTSPADDLASPDRPIEEVVDRYIEATLKAEGVTPAPPADDANLVRRLTLDLAGRIPTAAEARAYVESSDPAKRSVLVDRLMASPGFVRHQANEFDAMLMAGTRGSLRDYLARAIGEKRPWDRIFREILLTDETDPAQKGAGEFLRSRIKDLDRMTVDVSTTFFGVNVSCARCHDHPRVRDWKQDHYFGMKSFFARTFENGGYVAERETEVVKFLTTDGLEKKARLMFLTGRVIDEPAAPEPTAEEKQEAKKRLAEAKKKKLPPPPPKFSARAQLVEVALGPDERDFFARAIVNRVWSRLFGRGLVMPLDQMHSENPPSHPDLLRWLARDTVEHGYDLRRLTRGLVLSRAYARSSRHEGEGEPPRPSLFAVAEVRPLSPLQLAASMRIATADPATFAADLKPEEFERRIESFESAARGFADAIGPRGVESQIGVSEALLLSNGDRIQDEFLSESGDRLVGRLAQIPDRAARVELAARAILSRPPDAEESRLLGDYLAGREDRPVEACRQLVWALLTCSEFRFNY